MKASPIIATLALMSAFALPVLAQPQPQPQPQRPVPALSQAQATSIATTRVPGTVTHAEMEFEHHRWIYSFAIRTAPRVVMEVNVDANTGAVVEVSRD